MSIELQQLIKEVKQKKQLDNLSKKQLTALEEQTFYDLNKECAKCGRCSRVDDLTLDHIIPKFILEQFGIDTQRVYIEGNYQILCRVCNVFKANRLDFANPQTKPLLIKLIEKI
jgi:5-methylcytosine-specific restriction endonuclease McrA